MICYNSYYSQYQRDIKLDDHSFKVTPNCSTINENLYLSSHDLNRVEGLTTLAFLF
jgi:hypothetical protein